MKNTMEKVGVWSFIIGLLLVVIAAFAAPDKSWVLWLLGVLGVIVGLINISDKETMLYLIAAIALIAGMPGLTSAIAALGVKVQYADNLLKYLTAFVEPGAVVVAIKAIFELAKSK